MQNKKLSLALCRVLVYVFTLVVVPRKSYGSFLRVFADFAFQRVRRADSESLTTVRRIDY